MTDEINHGTYSGYQKHKRLRVPICDECREANRVYHAQYRKDPGTMARERERNRIADVARRMVVARHLDEYYEIVDELNAEAEAARDALREQVAS